METRLTNSMRCMPYGRHFCFRGTSLRPPCKEGSRHYTKRMCMQTAEEEASMLQGAYFRSVHCRASREDDLLTNIEESTQDAAKKDASRRGFGNSTSPAPNKKRQKEVQRPFQEASSSRQQPSPSAAATLEGYVIGLLTLLFIVFILEGIFLAISGFLPEEADNFALSVVYPAFSPTLGVFIAISAIYGLVKSRQGESK